MSGGSLSFGTARQLSLLEKAVTLKNAGTVAVSISKVSVTPGAGTDAYDFTPLSFCPSSLWVSKSCEIFTVLFAKSQLTTNGPGPRRGLC